MQCRVCMQTKCHILLDMGIVGTEDGKTLYDYFNECTQLEASANDNFPNTLCKICAQKLQIAYNFRKCARQSHADFKKLLTTQKMEAESVHSSTEELYAFNDMEETTDDPLDMEFNEAVKALREPELEFPLEDDCIDESSPQFFEETQEEVERDRNTELINDNEHATDLLCEISNDNLSLTATAKESEKEDSGEESETEPIERVGYTCEICNCIYTIKNELKKHISKQHKSEIICVNCSKIFDMPHELRIHKKLVHETNSPVQCDFCQEKPLMPRSELLKHFQSNHSSRYFKYFPRLRKGRVNSLGTPTFKCKYCRSIFSSAFELEDHVKTHVFKCPFCSKNFSRVRTYYTHAKRLHNCSASSFPPTPFIVEGVEIEKDKPIECKACNKSYRNLGSYNTHIKQKHKKRVGSNAMKTTTVQTNTEKQSTLIETVKSSVDPIQRKSYEFNQIVTKDESHQNKQIYGSLEIKQLEEDNQEQQESTKANWHEDGSKFKEKKRYLCSFCPRVLSTSLALESHERKQHLNIKTELKECPICQKKLNPDYIRRHVEMVHIGDRKFTCDICNDSYKSHTQLSRHKLLHKKVRNFPCTACDKRFTEKSELKVHMRVHTGELPFACHLCDRRFRIKVRLTYHLQHHANIKRKCKVCGKEFKNGTSLRIHSWAHTGVMPYRCLVCDYGCVKREYFTRHMQRKHDTTMTADELFAMFKENTGRSPYVKPVEDTEIMNPNSDHGENPD
ncbi:zinc finger protein 665-like [Anastrepha ludens]|uniref:zinc finger protein 665-like n=1 Tax=Anastrepha ludens TaxID=28586 RepID=UPI0023B04CE9|nr:zinc finger protein 665-like [Anastrepha ludens]